MGCNPDICIICIWPDYRINVSGLSVPLLGHAGVLLIEGGTGAATAHYYEYGRYPGPNPAVENHKVGNVRDYSVSGIVLRQNGWPTVESLHQAVKFITEESGRNTRFHGNVDHKCGDCYEKGVAYAEAFRTNPDYNIITNSCMTFAFRVNKAGGWSWFGPVPILNSRPAGQVDVGFFQNFITYNPEGNVFREHVWQM